ncbi:cytochrome-c peroxidase [Pelomonas sp. KK5]|uniref:cytochrome-c peroxidase n=1 Tax=Pelomonas sp. KK5 TaxID=1855730 RepID=UPI00097C0A24|nr:cytochrome c peroxidase [Pelomonas sp. KK5]
MKSGLVAALTAGALALPIAIAWACSGEALPEIGTELYHPGVYGDRPKVEDLQALGRKIFFDPSLSASGRQSCASCHDPKSAFGPPNALAVQPGGPKLDRLGFRSTPSLTYLHSPIAFTEHFYESEPNGSGGDDEGPTGGRTWDGRVNTGHDQALMPLLDPNEMGNKDHREVLQRLMKAPYADEFKALLSAPGENVFDDLKASIAWVTVALEAYEGSPAEFHAFTSKYDAYLRDEAELKPAELRGLALFNDMKKGNCASCHTSSHKNPGSHLPIFSDFGHVALAVPRNAGLPANRDPAFFDLGLCGPLRSDLASHPEYCGAFRTPTLRNVARKKSFFHNGAMHSLRDVVEFYATRDTNPAKWYGRDAAGKPRRYDDLPERYWGNVNADVPFKPLKNGQPRLNAREIDDIVAFLSTLSDGYTAYVPKPIVAAAAAGR